MKIISVFIFLLISSLCISQQFTLVELTEMLNDQKLYESKNILKGNSVVLSDEYAGRSRSGEKGTPDYNEYTDYTIKLNFAENYNAEYETAATWYDLAIVKDIKIISQGKGRKVQKPSKSLKVYYSHIEDYMNILEEVNAKAKYIGLKEKWGSYYATYEYNGLIVKLNKDDEEGTGTIQIVKGDSPF